LIESISTTMLAIIVNVSTVRMTKSPWFSISSGCWL